MYTVEAGHQAGIFSSIYWIDTMGPLGNKSSNAAQQVTRSQVMISYGNKLSLTVGNKMEPGVGHR